MVHTWFCVMLTVLTCNVGFAYVQKSLHHICLGDFHVWWVPRHPLDAFYSEPQHPESLSHKNSVQGWAKQCSTVAQPAAMPMTLLPCFEVLMIPSSKSHGSSGT